MVTNLDALSEVVDQATLDRKLADKIEAELDRIKAEIDDHGYGEVTVDGKKYRVTKKNAA